MITRYSRPEMRAIWTDENKLRIWLQIELLASEALVKQGIVPGSRLRQNQGRLPTNGLPTCPASSRAKRNWRKSSITTSSPSPPPSPKKSKARPAAGSISA